MTSTAQQATAEQNTRAFRLPDVGEGLTEAEIVAWHVAVGDEVHVNQVLVEIETAKSIVELPSPFSGCVSRLVAQQGETIPVGEVIIEFAAEGAAAAAADSVEQDPALKRDSSRAEASDATDAPEQKPAGAEEPKLLVGYGAIELEKTSRRRRPVPAAKTAATAATPRSSGTPSADVTTTGSTTVGASSTGASSSGLAEAPGSAAAGEPLSAAVHADALPEKPRAKPPVRGLAKQLGIDLATVIATGPDGTVSREDVQHAADRSAQGGTGTLGTAVDGSSASITTATTPAGEQTRIPIKGVRKATAAAMVQSAFTAPHVTEFITVDVTRSLELLADLQGRREFRELKLTPLTLIARAYLIALSRTPLATAHWDDAAQEIVIPSAVNLGIAAATPRGLLVPNIKNAGLLGLADLARAIGELAQTARDGKTQPADLAGGSTTITNVGVFGVDAGTPILNPGETAILAVGAIKRRPWVVGTGDHERIEPRSVMQLALSFDHRVLDGAEGSRVLADTAELLEQPGFAML